MNQAENNPRAVLTAGDMCNPDRLLRKLYLLIILSIGLVACNAKSLQPIGSHETILAFGDSLTEGKGVSRNQSYPAVLQRISKRRVVNAGISGETTTNGLSRLPGVLDQVRPALIVLLHGGNDILRNMDLAQTRRNLSTMIQMAQRRGIQILLVGVPQKSLFSDSAALYGELADQYDLAFHDDIVADLIRSPSKKSDSVHFNATGYRELAQAIYDKLAGSGAL